MSFNLSLLSQIIIFILVGLLFGLTLLAFNIQSSVENILTNFFLFFEVDSIRKMVRKNLSSHRKRNQMTALIYSLALGFLIFLSISSRMQISISYHEELKNKGAQFSVEMIDRVKMPVTEVEKILEANDHIIESFSWVTAPISNYQDSFIIKANLDNLVNFRAIPMYVYATQPNYFQTAESNYLMEYYVFFDPDDDFIFKNLGFTHEHSVATELGEILYTPRGSQGIATFGWIDDTYSVWPLYDQPERIKNKDYGTSILKLRLETDQH